mmetsp:Transcript_10624/g.27865  ORF Transcript_10624/g.27865 Transcript_10624/m.27865 type:complete len:217 (+) Transcript_10624:172-822(+)
MKRRCRNHLTKMLDDIRHAKRLELQHAMRVRDAAHQRNVIWRHQLLHPLHIVRTEPAEAKPVGRYEHVHGPGLRVAVHVEPPCVDVPEDRAEHGDVDFGDRDLAGGFLAHVRGQHVGEKLGLREEDAAMGKDLLALHDEGEVRKLLVVHEVVEFVAHATLLLEALAEGAQAPQLEEVTVEPHFRNIRAAKHVDAPDALFALQAHRRVKLTRGRSYP